MLIQLLLNTTNNVKLLHAFNLGHNSKVFILPHEGTTKTHYARFEKLQVALEKKPRKNCTFESSVLLHF